MDQAAVGRNERVERVNDQRGTKGSFLPARATFKKRRPRWWWWWWRWCSRELYITLLPGPDERATLAWQSPTIVILNPPQPHSFVPPRGIICDTISEKLHPLPSFTTSWILLFNGKIRAVTRIRVNSWIDKKRERKNESMESRIIG